MISRDEVILCEFFFNSILTYYTDAVNAFNSQLFIITLLL